MYRDTTDLPYNTRYESLVIPDLSGTSVYLIVYDEGATPDYFICKYVFAESKYFVILLEEYDFSLDVVLISDTDLFLGSIKNVTTHQQLMRISRFQ